jgi:hypothetical protein
MELLVDVPFTLGILIAVRPRAPGDIFPVWHGDVQAIKRADKLFGLPKLLEYLDHTRFSAGFPCHFLVWSTIGKVHAAYR